MIPIKTISQELAYMVMAEVSDKQMDELAKLWSSTEYEDVWGKRELIIHRDDYANTEEGGSGEDTDSNIQTSPVVDDILANHTQHIHIIIFYVA